VGPKVRYIIYTVGSKYKHKRFVLERVAPEPV